MIPKRLERGKILSAIEGVVDTWDWFIDKIKGIRAGKGINVKHTDDGVEISADPPVIYAGDGIVVNQDAEGGYEIALADTGDEEDLPDLPELPMLDLEGILEIVKTMFIAGDDTDIRFTPVTNPNNPNYGKVKVDVYYK